MRDRIDARWWWIGGGLLFLGLVVLIFSNRDSETIETFADGITGNQAIREGVQLDDQLKEIADRHNRMIEEAIVGEQ